VDGRRPSWLTWVLVVLALALLAVVLFSVGPDGLN
jgi:hypothetical protein